MIGDILANNRPHFYFQFHMVFFFFFFFFFFFEVIGFSRCQSSNTELAGEALEVIGLPGPAGGDAGGGCKERRDRGLGGSGG